jgi:hypothetical protein
MPKKPKIDHEYHAGKDKMKNDSGVFAEQNVSRRHHQETDGAA